MRVIPFRPSTPPVRLPLNQVSLFLDLDGTLLSFESDPAAVRADAACREMLMTAQTLLDGRLAIISGRSVASVDDVLAGGVLSVAGIHGLQSRTASSGVTETPAHPAIGEVADILEAFAKADRGLRVERKGQSVAIHFRQTPSAAEAVTELVERLAAPARLEVQHGAMVAEVRTPGPHKGAAVRQFMHTQPFARTRPIFIGDDLTDEAGFRTAQEMGGAGILVGEPRATTACGRLADPTAVRQWISGSLTDGHFDLAQAEWRRRI